MIVADAPNLKIGFKRKELVPGTRYVIKQRGRGWPIHPLIYRHVHLVELQSGNRALVQWDEACYTTLSGQPLAEMPVTHKGKAVGKRVRTAIVSCSTFMATEADWDRFPKHWNAKRKCLMLDMTDIQGEQSSIETMDSLRRGHHLAEDDPNYGSPLA